MVAHRKSTVNTRSVLQSWTIKSNLEGWLEKRVVVANTTLSNLREIQGLSSILCLCTAQTNLSNHLKWLQINWLLPAAPHSSFCSAVLLTARLKRSTFAVSAGATSSSCLSNTSETTACDCSAHSSSTAGSKHCLQWLDSPWYCAVIEIVEN